MRDKGIYYNAGYSGVITLKDGLTESNLSYISDEASAVSQRNEMMSFGDWDECLGVNGSGYYSQSDWEEFLLNIKPFVSTGFINFRGDDDALWRFHFVTDNWYEEHGSIVYDETRAILIEIKGVSNMADDYNKLKEELLKRCEDEYESFRDEVNLCGYSPTEILDFFSYRHIIYEDILSCLEDVNLSVDQYTFLLSSNSPLESIFQFWLDWEDEHMDDIRSMLCYIKVKED